MKRNIRYNTFETNSSSTHAICISNKKWIYSLDESDYSLYHKVPLKFKCDTFDWEFSVLDTPEEKASYLYTAICELYGDYEENKKGLKTTLGLLGDILDDYDIKYTFVPRRKDRFGGDYGYIDHCGELIPFIEGLLNSKSKLLTYLFGDSFIVTGNDNGDDDGCKYDTYMYGKTDNNLWWQYSTDYKEEFADYDIFEKGN